MDQDRVAGGEGCDREQDVDDGDQDCGPVQVPGDDVCVIYKHSIRMI